MRKIAFIIVFMVSLSCYGHVNKINWSLKNRLSGEGYFSRQYDGFGMNFEWLPEASLSYNISDVNEIHAEFSYLSQAGVLFNTLADETNKHGEPYRYWVRFSSPTTETRIGLQQINFGEAKIYRPLQWFDQINPTDNNLTTHGVKAVLLKSSTIENQNIWLWGVLDENSYSNKNNYDIGGRIQVPITTGEAGISFSQQEIIKRYKNQKCKTSIGIDARMDYAMGLWIESSISTTNDYYLYKGRLRELNTTIGTDYTFNIGEGIYTVLEINRKGYAESGYLEFDKNNSDNIGIMTNYPNNINQSINTLSQFDVSNGSNNQTIFLRNVNDYTSTDLGFSYIDENKKSYSIVYIKLNYYF